MIYNWFFNNDKIILKILFCDVKIWLKNFYKSSKILVSSVKLLYNFLFFFVNVIKKCGLRGYLSINNFQAAPPI